MEVFEFWPSDFLRIFKQAGVSLKTPPPYQAGCDFTDKAASGQVPVITSPQSSVEYVIRTEFEKDRQIPLKAVVDSSVKKLHWFVDDSYVGSIASGEPLLWSANAGVFRVRAVDDSGRSASQAFTVVHVQ